jgi:glucose uptake protein
LVFPSSWLTAFLLLLFSACSLGLWPAAYTAAGKKYRFEIFSLDFAVGAIVLALVAAFTVGTLGAELSFSDTMLVAGRRAQIMAFMAGAVFALGNMLLLSTVSLIGLSRAVLLSSSLAAAILAALSINRANWLFVVPGAALFLIGAAISMLSATPKKALPPRPGIRGSTNKQLSEDTKGTITGIVSGLALGVVLPVMRLAQSDELGIGPYGGVLMACLGMLAATPFLNFYFMNLAIEGGSLGVSAYWQGKAKQRILGITAGSLWAAGALALYVVITAPKPLEIQPALTWGTPFAAVLLTAIAGGGRSKFVLAAMALFICGAGLFVFSLR